MGDSGAGVSFCALTIRPRAAQINGRPILVTGADLLHFPSMILDRSQWQAPVGDFSLLEEGRAIKMKNER